MTVTALITEYNPFHNGHAYHIREARRRTDADFLIVLMSGNFVQRGEPAIIDKFSRAEMAVRCGADLVLELPVRYACGSAEFFAGGAVSLLHALGCVDHLCFGCESERPDILEKVAEVLADEPDSYREALRIFLKEGQAFPRARQSALIQYFAGTHDAVHAALRDVLSEPNNILAIEYLKAIKKLNSSIKPVAILRRGCHYHDTAMDTFCSAAALRKVFSDAALRKTFSDVTLRETFSGAGRQPDISLWENIALSVPEDVCRLLKENWQHTFPVFLNDFSSMLHYRLLTAAGWEEYAECFDVSESIARRIYQMRYQFTDISSFAASIKTRNLTEAYIKRSLLHILLKLPELDRKDGFPVYYARILGLRRSAGPLFRRIKECGHLPLLSKPADARNAITCYYPDGHKAEDALKALSLDISASEIYAAACTAKFGLPAVSEYTRQIFTLNS